MNTHADKIQENKNSFLAHAQKQGGGESTFQFVDNRPEFLVQRKLQRKANNSLRTKKFTKLQVMTAKYSIQQAIQKPKNDNIIQKYSFENRLEHHGWSVQNGFTFIKNGGTLYLPNMGDLLIAKNVKHQPTMILSLQYAANRFSEIGNMANRIKAADGGMANSPNPRNPNNMYPFVFQISVPFGKKDNHKTLTVKYQYANNATGYVIAQEVTGEGESDMTNAPNTNAAPGFAGTYFSTHGNTGATKLSDLIEQDSSLPEQENAERLDARTKLAGEGARFNVVKDNMATISDRTIIYTEDKTHAYYIRFRSLWMNWGGLFNSAYGITNDQLATQLINPAVWNLNYAPTKIKKGMLKESNTIKV